MRLKKLKIIKKESVNCTNTKVYDIEVKDSHHYILENGVVSHNSGPFFNASTVIALSTAQLKETPTSKAKVGIVVTSKIIKSRFTKAGIPIKFHISFYKGMNPYVGLEDFVDWDTCGIAPGKIDKKGNFEPSGSKITTFAVKHLGRNLKRGELWNSQVFTPEVMEALNKKLVDIFKLPDPTDMLFDTIVDVEDEDVINPEIFGDIEDED